MPNKMNRYKRGVGDSGHKGGRSRRIQSVDTLLNRLGSAVLGRVSEQARKQKDWRAWLRTTLPAELVSHVSGVVERGETLVVFAESAAWSARLRYAVVEIEGRLREAHPNIKEVKVRVLPRSAGRP
jgi:hypothetical protein